MSIVDTASNPYGPATMDIQIEQGCDIEFTFTVQEGTPPVAINIAGYVFTAEFSPQWSPGANAIPFTCEITNAAYGELTVSMLGSATLDVAFPLPNPPMKTFNSLSQQKRSRVYYLGGWALYMTDTSGFRRRLVEGVVQFDRDPASGG